MYIEHSIKKGQSVILEGTHLDPVF